MKIVGIDIGSSSIKIVEMAPSSTGGSVTNYSEIKLSGDAGSDHRLEIVASLREFISRYDMDSTHFCVGLHHSYVTHRKLQFPIKERHNIQRILPFEIEENIPLSLDNAIIDARILSYEGNSSHVLASATSHAHVEEIINLCQDSGFDPFIVSTNALAYANLFEDWTIPPIERTVVAELDEGEDKKEIPKQDAGILLNIGHSSSQMLAYSNKELFSIRSFNWGSRQIAEALSRKYDLPPKEARKELESKGFVLLQETGATKDQIVFSNTIKETIDEFVHDLRLTIIEIESKHNVEVKKCSLTGGASQIKNFGAYITQKIEIVTNPLQIQPQNIQFEVSSFNMQTGGIALGLAIEGLKKPRNPATNFLKGPFARQNKKFEMLWDKWNHALKVASAGFVVLVAFSCARQEFTLNMSDISYQKLTAKAKKILPDKKRTGILRRTRAYISSQKKIEKNAKVVEKLGQINSALDVMKNLSEVAPKNGITLDVTRLNINDETLNIEGLLGERDPVSAFEAALRGLSSNNKVTRKPALTRAKPGKRAFAYSLKINRNKGEQ